jgi:hypothetical protein
VAEVLLAGIQARGESPVVFPSLPLPRLNNRLRLLSPVDSASLKNLLQRRPNQAASRNRRHPLNLVFRDPAGLPGPALNNQAASRNRRQPPNLVFRGPAGLPGPALNSPQRNR